MSQEIKTDKIIELLNNASSVNEAVLCLKKLLCNMATEEREWYRNIENCCDDLAKQASYDYSALQLLIDEVINTKHLPESKSY
jgi:hypothetical protein